MKYLTAKIIAASLLVIGSFSQATINPQDPTWGWDEFKELKCADGYNKVSNYCVKCDTASGKNFDTVTKQCRTCPTGTKYSATKQSCECDCVAPRQISPTTKKCECPGGQTFINNECKCPEEKPLWNGKTCVACPPGTTF